MQKRLIILFFALIGFQAFAQTGPRGERPPMPNAERFTERMTKELNLNAATSKKVHDAFLINIKKMETVFASKVEEKDKRATLDENKKEFVFEEMLENEIKITVNNLFLSNVKSKTGGVAFKLKPSAAYIFQIL
jgi:hypothetical protein